MRVLLTGANGFVGAKMMQDLLAQGHEVIASVHSERSASALPKSVIPVVGDIADPRLKEKLPAGIDAIIYLPGLLREFPGKGITFQNVHVEGVRNLLDFARRSNVKRWIQMSALGSRPNAPTRYFQTKWDAEQLVRASGLDWTIFRPSVVFSDEPSDRMNFVSELAKIVKMAPVLPVFGDGNYRMQPVGLGDVSRAFVDALTMPQTIHETYELAGATKITYNDMMRMLAASMGKKKPLFHVPFAMVRPIAKLLQGFPFFPVTNDQLTMLEEENIIRDEREMTKLKSTFKLPKEDFREALRTLYGH
jgi:uncharacterized protein YbjT (DUF2867 family)